MAKKLAPLVIPAVIDTSGIDRGVNSIRSKLSRVRGQGAGGGGIGGGGGGFSSGVTPFGLPFAGGGSATAAAMAAAFGASVGQRNTDRSPIKWAAGSGPFPAGQGRRWGAAPDPAAFKRAYPAATNATVYTNFTANATPQLNLAEYKYMRADVRSRARDRLSERNLSINSIADARDALEIATSRRRDLIRQKRIEPYRQFGNKLRGLRGIGFEGGAGAGAALYGGLRALEGISPLGIQSTFGNLKPFENRAAGQYDIAQGMRNRAMTATQGNLTMGQQFLLGAGQAKGGGVTRTEQMGAGLYEGLGTAVGAAGGLFEQTLSAGIGFVEGGLQRAFMGGGGAATGFNPMMNPFNWIKRLYN